ncbi:MAG: endonuclease MutS2 [Clostridia bacterium]|nr:endonuclease MutS2 [Clostridia bacterium]
MNKHYKALELDKILNMLQECAVSEGAKVKAVETQPENNLEKAKKLIQKTDDAYKLISGFSTPPFSGTKDVTAPLSRAASGGMLNNSELLRIGGVLKNVTAIKEWRSHSEGISTSIDGLFANLYENKRLADKIFTCIRNEEELNDNASDTLFSIRRKITSISNSIREKLEKITRSSSTQKYLQDSIVTQRNGRYVVPVKSEYKGEVAGLVHDTSATGSTVFIEPMAVVEANNEIKILRREEAEEIERILFELSAECAEVKESILNSLWILTELDYIFAKAKLAQKMNASKPLLNDNCYIELRNARHPLLDKNSVVPINVTLGKDYKMLVITGPNTGGKTVTIKTIGLITLMAECGLLIPCSEGSEIAVFTNVFSDIGDEQSIEQSLSTFSSHIKNIVSILEIVDNNSLVLLDELCSGTDPIEGAALAASILESFRKFGATLAATTHYAELKAYALDTDGVSNACCEFDVKTLAPTYRLLVGVPGKSNAFAISSKLGMDESVIKRAKSMITEENNRFERVIEELQSKQKEYDDKIQKAETALKTANQKADEVNKKTEALRKEYNEQIENAKAQARIIADNARIEANRLLDELQKLKKQGTKEAAAKAELEARKSFNKLDEISSSGDKFNDNYKLPRPLKIGDTILMPDTNTKAVVLTLPDNKNKIQVQAGIMKIKIPADNVRLVEEKKVNIPKSVVRRTGVDSKKTRSASLEIDVRGMTVDEATMDIDRFIDNAVLGSMNQFTIIHGKGTGALRKGIHTFLRNHQNVRTFRVGLFGEGENGVTIVELK